MKANPQFVALLSDEKFSGAVKFVMGVWLL